jgi:hypothetical protein
VSVEVPFGKVRQNRRTFPLTLTKMASEATFWKGVLHEAPGQSRLFELPNKKGNPGECAGLPLIYHTV